MRGVHAGQGAAAALALAQWFITAPARRFGVAYLDLPAANDLDGPARDVLEDATRRWGFAPNIVRALALRPEILAAEDHWTQAVMHSGLLPRGLKEAVATVVSTVNRTPYCATSHADQARRAGVPAERVAACRTFDFTGFSVGERKALEFARKAAQDARTVSRADMEGLRMHYSREQCVELVMVVASFAMYNTFVSALGLELEPEQAVGTARAG